MAAYLKFFKCIALAFATHASNRVIEAQVEDIIARLPRRCQPNTPNKTSCTGTNDEGEGGALTGSWAMKFLASCVLRQGATSSATVTASVIGKPAQVYQDDAASEDAESSSKVVDVDGWLAPPSALQTEGSLEVDDIIDRLPCKSTVTRPKAGSAGTASSSGNPSQGTCPSTTVTAVTASVIGKLAQVDQDDIASEDAESSSEASGSV